MNYLNMDELFASEDRLKQLFQSEGRLTTSPGFTDRVMEKVARMQSPETVYKPLLSRRMWFLIAATVAFLVACCWWVSGTYSQEEPQFAKIFEPVAGFIKGIEFHPVIATEFIFMITLVVGVISLLLAIDYLLNNKLQNILKG
jgi:hypothetical protein